MKKVFAYLLIVALFMAFCGCEKDVVTAGPSKEVGTTPGDSGMPDSTVPQLEISDSGYGRMEYTAGGLKFRVGNTVDEFVKAGFVAEKEDIDTVLEPWGFKQIWMDYDAGREYPATMVVTVLNESDAPQYVRYCRTVTASARYAVEYSNQIKADTSSRADIEQLFPEKDMMCEQNMVYGLLLEMYSTNVIAVGNTFNCVKYRVDSETDLFNGIEIVYLENVLKEIDYSSIDSMSEYTPIHAASLLSAYFDTLPYLTYYGGLENFESLDKVLNTKTLSIELDGKEFQLGQENDTFVSLTEKGWSFTIWEDSSLDANDSCSYMDMVKIGNSEIHEIEFTNVSDSEASWKEAKITGISIENRHCVSSLNKNAPEFNFYGLTESSTIEDLVRNLGVPSDISYSTRGVHLAQMVYRFEVDSNYSIKIRITVDAINNSIYNIELDGDIEK